jgi:cystathionine gamma-synthase
MVVLVPQSEVGHAPPPATPYSIATHLPTWRAAEQLRDGDPALMAKLVHIYPRFMPMHYAKEVSDLLREEGESERERAREREEVLGD